MAKTSLQQDMMPKADMVRLLNLATSEPLGCVVALTKEKDDALLLIDKIQKGKKLAEKLKKDKGDEIDPKSVRFGEVTVTGGGQVVALRLNKPVLTGTSIHLNKTLKRAGYGSVTFEEDENVGGDDEAADPAAPAATGTATDAPAGDTPATPAAPQPEPPQPAASQPAPPPPEAAASAATSAEPSADAPAEPARDASGLAPGQLEALVRRVKPAIAADPASARGIVAAVQALKVAAEGGGDARAQAQTLLDVLDKAENAAPAAPPAADAPLPPIERTQEIVSRADDIWRTSSDRLRQTLERLKTSIFDAYGDNPTVQQAIRARIGEVDRALAWLDDRLTRKIADARNATDPAERRRLAREGVAIAAEYVATVKANPLIRDIDTNPFGVDTKFNETIDKVMPAVTKLMQAA